MAVFGPKTLADGNAIWGMVDRVTLLVCGHGVYTDEVWRRLLMDVKASCVACGVPSRSTISFYASAGTSASHRKIAAEFVDAEAKLGRHVVLSDSSFQRGAVTALSWLIPSLKLGAFATNDLERASEWVAEVDPHDTKAAVALLRNALKDLRVVRAA